MKIRSIRNIFRGSLKRPNVIVLSIVLFVIFVQEFLVYYLKPYSWHTLPSDWCNQKEGSSTTCTKILLVADPQLIGLHNEQIHALTPFSILDSDWYLSQTYHHALQFAKPDVVIFLGDLLDEGSRSTDAEYYGYVKRLFNIFLINRTSTAKHLWLPGDNDIGGEAGDMVTANKLKRFYRSFPQPDVVSYHNINFVIVNRLIKSIPKMKDKKDFFDTNEITIVVSHMPLLFMPGMFVDQVLSKFEPQLLFTAHEHKSMIVSINAITRTDRLITPVTPVSDKIVHVLNLGTDMFEILVPTCSYRMGTNQVGYGFAAINGGLLFYTVLWSPSRFPQLKVYGVLCAFLAVYGIWLCRCSCKRIASFKYRRLSNAT